VTLLRSSYSPFLSAGRNTHRSSTDHVAVGVSSSVLVAVGVGVSSSGVFVAVAVGVSTVGDPVGVGADAVGDAVGDGVLVGPGVVAPGVTDAVAVPEVEVGTTPPAPILTRNASLMAAFCAWNALWTGKSTDLVRPATQTPPSGASATPAAAS
jgi:hypothetical protein